MCIQTDQFWLLMVEQKSDKDYTLKWCRLVTILTVNQITSTNRVVSVTNLLVQFWLDLATEQVNLGELWLIPKTGETEKARARAKERARRRKRRGRKKRRRGRRK